tara:strand:- start:1741 stop:2385 length:645 start_codon:yes stop_codon:yes gene_type:complete
VIYEKRLQEAFVDVQAIDLTVPEERGVVWRARTIRDYEKAMQAFREHLLVLVHITGGQPARGTEVVTVQYVNSPNGESRGVFIEDGLMVYVTMYHKGIRASAKAKIIHRYLPREVGELLFYYLWIVMPFWRKIEGAVGKEAAKEASPFIWEPREEEPWARPQRRKRVRERNESESESESEVWRRGADEDEGEEEREEEQGEGMKEEERLLCGPE